MTDEPKPLKIIYLIYQSGGKTIKISRLGMSSGDEMTATYTNDERLKTPSE